MDQVSIKYTNIFHCKTLQNLPKLEFLVWKKPSGKPGKETSLFKIFLGQRLYFSFSNTQTMLIESLFTTALQCFPKNLTYTLAVFEPGSSVPQADAMTTAPRRQGTDSSFFPDHTYIYVNLPKGASGGQRPVF
jgi:hypothetical protein